MTEGAPAAPSPPSGRWWPLKMACEGRNGRQTMSNAKNRWNNGRINATRPDVEALRTRAATRLRNVHVHGFTADAAEAIANVNTDTDDDGWAYVVMPMAVATARGFEPTNDGGWCVMVMDETAEVLGFL